MCRKAKNANWESVRRPNEYPTRGNFFARQLPKVELPDQVQRALTGDLQRLLDHAGRNERTRERAFHLAPHKQEPVVFLETFGRSLVHSIDPGAPPIRPVACAPTLPGDLARAEVR